MEFRNEEKICLSLFLCVEVRFLGWSPSACPLRWKAPIPPGAKRNDWQKLCWGRKSVFDGCLSNKKIGKWVRPTEWMNEWMDG